MQEALLRRAGKTMSDLPATMLDVALGRGAKAKSW